MSIQSTGANAPAPVTAKSLFGKLKGEQFGGGSNYLQLEIGQESGPFTHVRIDRGVKLTDDTSALDLHVATNPDGDEIRMPAASIFRRNIAEANPGVGDQYHVARLPDAIKQTGSKATGKGREMEVYAVLVTKRTSRNKALSKDEMDKLFGKKKS